MRSGSGLEAAERAYAASTPTSKELWKRAQRVMPGGTTRTTTFFRPHPLYIDRARGCRVLDVDGTERLDFICNYTAMIHGHAHPAVVSAVTTQASRGTGFAAASRLEVELAEELCKRVPSVEQVRFTNSGTEATMFALRTARVYTGRDRIARFEGGYHGTHDYAEVSNHPAPSEAGPSDEPVAVPDSPGTPSAALASTVVLPFNNAAACERILRRHAGELAAVIVEPILGGGAVVATEDFLQCLRRITSELGILLIFDEVISLRVGPGGAQERYGVKPDLTTMGKIIGGGLPVAAFGGSTEVMSVLDPERQSPIRHGGTYNGNPLGMAAGLAALRELTPGAYDGLARRGERLRDGLRAAFEDRDLPAQVTGDASLFCIHFTNRPVVDYRSLAARDERLNREFFLRMLAHGILLAPRGLGAVCTPMGDEEIARFLRAAGAVAQEMVTTPSAG